MDDLNTKLTILKQLPEGFLDCPARDLHQILSGPTLIHLEGRHTAPVFVSVLLHGNETVGLQAIQQCLKHYQQQALPRALSLFIGNVSAAKAGLRRHSGQVDYNRVWPGTDLLHCAEQRIMQTVVDEMKARQVFISVDLHNNTGSNPHYACINDLRPQYLQLATLFSRIVVYFLQPHGVQSLAFAPLCPAATLECGKVGDQSGIEHATRYIDACLHISELPAHPPTPQDIDLFHTKAIVTLPRDLNFSIGGDSGDSADLCLLSDIDHYNFRELSAGTLFGHCQTSTSPLLVHDEAGNNVSEQYFEVRDQAIFLKKPLMPSMLTLDTTVIRQDCLCYLMERYPLPAFP